MIGTNLSKAKRLLESSKVIAIPTETVYGLAANAFDLHALKKLFAIKKRPHAKPFVVQTHSLEKVTHLVKCIPPKAQKLMQAFWPGPLTLLLEKKSCIPDLVTAGSNTVGIRIPNHSITLQLLQNLSFPLAVPSANLSGHISPTTPQHVYKELGNKIPYILDGGKCRLGFESTIIGFNQNEPVLYRLGCISQVAIEKIIGPIAQHIPLMTSGTKKK